MTALILSFSPAVFPSLLTGQKHFEYRKRLPKGNWRAYLYLSSPVKAIVGYLNLGERLEISDLLASDLAEPIKARLFRFTETYASPIRNFGLFDEPVPLETIRELGGQAPQSFVYAQTYPLLAEALRGQSASVYPINLNQALDGLGWFSQELLKQHPRVIPLPASLLCHFPKNKKI